MRISAIILIFIGILLASSCENETEKNINGIFYQPILLQVNLSNSILNLDTDTTGSVDSLGLYAYNISITASGSGIIPAERITEGSVRLYKPGSSAPFYRRSWNIIPTASDTAQFSIPLSFQIKRSDVGFITFEFALQINTGEISNTVIKSLLIARNNIKPYLKDVVAPDTIYRPASGTILLIFSVSAADSDGYSDLKEVFFKRILPTETGNFSLFDDGDRLTSGDEVPGDGRFSRILSIDSTARLGDQVFLFRALDMSGAVSDSLLHTITILQ